MTSQTSHAALIAVYKSLIESTGRVRSHHAVVWTQTENKEKKQREEKRSSIERREIAGAFHSSL